MSILRCPINPPPPALCACHQPHAHALPNPCLPDGRQRRHAFRGRSFPWSASTRWRVQLELLRAPHTPSLGCSYDCGMGGVQGRERVRSSAARVSRGAHGKCLWCGHKGVVCRARRNREAGVSGLELASGQLPGNRFPPKATEASEPEQMNLRERLPCKVVKERVSLVERDSVFWW